MKRTHTLTEAAWADWWHRGRSQPVGSNGELYVNGWKRGVATTARALRLPEAPLIVRNLGAERYLHKRDVEVVIKAIRRLQRRRAGARREGRAAPHLRRADGMKGRVKVPPILDAVTDAVLRYRPKPKSKKAKKRQRRRRSAQA